MPRVQSVASTPPVTVPVRRIVIVCIVWMLTSALLPAFQTPAAQSPTPPTPTPVVRIRPLDGPADSLRFGQGFQIELQVPLDFAGPNTWDVEITTPSGDRETVTLTRGLSGGMVTTYASEEVSIAGQYGGSPGFFGIGRIGEFTTEGTITGLDLANGDSISVEVKTPNWSAGSSILVFESETQQALYRGYTALAAHHQALLTELQFIQQLQASGLVTDPAMVSYNNFVISRNTTLLSWVGLANERLAKEGRPAAQLAILTNWLPAIQRTYEFGLPLDTRGANEAVNQQINSDIAAWRDAVPADALMGIGLAMYNGVTAIPFTGSGYTLASSLYATYDTGSIDAGQTVFGTQATTAQWIWAVVDVANGISLVRLPVVPPTGVLAPFRTPARAPLKALQAMNPIERSIFNHAAKLAERNAKPGASIADIVALHELYIVELTKLSSQMGVLQAGRFLDAANAAMKSGNAILWSDLLEASAQPRMLPPITSTTPNMAWGTPARPPVAGPGQAIPGGVISLDPMILAQARMLNKGMGGPGMLTGLKTNWPVIQNATKNLGLVRVVIANAPPRRLTMQEAIDLASVLPNLRASVAPAPKALGVLPLLGGLRTSMTSGTTPAAPQDAAPSLASDAGGLDLDFFLCPYGVPVPLPEPAGCYDWFHENPTPPSWTSWGWTPTQVYMGDAPSYWAQMSGGDGDGDIDLDPWELFEDADTDASGQGADAWMESVFGNAGAVYYLNGFSTQEPDRLARVRRVAAAIFTPPSAIHASTGFTGANRAPGGLVVRDQRLPAAGRPQLKAVFVSTGRMGPDAFKMTLINQGPNPVLVSGNVIALRPLKGVTERDVQRAVASASKFPKLTLDVAAYCNNFTKAPPPPGAVYGLAPMRSQLASAPVQRLSQAARRMRSLRQFKPDMDPVQYVHSIIQWARWTMEQKWDERAYTRAFVAHSRRNVESAGQRWTAALERDIAGLAPARWQAIQQLLTDARRLDRR